MIQKGMTRERERVRVSSHTFVYNLDDKQRINRVFRQNFYKINYIYVISLVADIDTFKI